MSESFAIWLFGAAFGLIGACFAWQWAHRNDCEKKRLENVAKLTKLEQESERLFEEVGRSHDEGLRGRVHKVENILSPSYLQWQIEQERRK